MDVSGRILEAREALALAEEPGLLHLPDVVALGEGAAQHLGRHSGALSLPGLRELSAADAKHLGQHCDPLLLNRLATLSADAAQALGHHRGGIALNGLRALSPRAARGLAKSRGDVWLNGLLTLDEATAVALAALRGTLHMHGLGDVDDAVLEVLACHAAGLSLGGLRSLSTAAARALAQHTGHLGLDGLSGIGLEAARCMGGHRGGLSLSGIEEIPPAVAEALAATIGDLHLDGVKTLSCAAARALSRHRSWLSLNGVSSIDADTARSLTQHHGWLSCMGLMNVSDEVAMLLAGHRCIKVAPPVDAVLKARCRASPEVRRPADAEQILGVAIIGAGFSGLCMARGLLEKGWHDFTIFEKAASLGGTWRDNTYPGCACDVPSDLYSFSFTPPARWTKRYASQPEILTYLKDFARAHHIDRWICFETAVVGLDWDERRRVWKLSAADGRVFFARTVVAAVGGIHIPHTPAIPGLETFAGPVFHTARWRHDIDLTGRRVAVIGTGASAVQVVPEVGRRAGRLMVFQRTPAWILPRNDRDYSRVTRWMATHMPGGIRLGRLVEYLAAEARAVPLMLNPRLMIHGQRKTDKFLKQCIKERQIRRKLIPRFTMGCKRILSSNDFYPTLAQDHVEVVPEPITVIQPWSVVTADGVARAVDAIVLATGFKPFNITDGMRVTGRDGRDLATAWQNGPEAFRGVAVAGFPNLFMVMGPNTALAHNSIVVMIEAQVRYIVQCLQWLRSGRLENVEVRADLQRSFNDRLQKRFSRTVWSNRIERPRGSRALVPCATWYRHPSGRNHVLWPGTSIAYCVAMRRADIRDFIQRADEAA